MDNYSIKSVTFGGFNKQDVIRYIEQTSKDAATVKNTLQSELDALRRENASLAETVSAMRAELEEAVQEKALLQEQLAQETAQRRSLESLKTLEEEMAQLQAEVDVLRPEAEAYAQFRSRIGAIECEARKRASDLEAAAAAQLQETLDLFREQYQILMSSLETASTYINSELRKVEVNLTQLPRAMDRTGAELNELAARLERIKEGQK